MNSGLKEAFEEMMDNYNIIKHEIRVSNPQLYEQWKAGGFLVDEDIMSMYPNITEVMEEMGYDENPEDDTDRNSCPVCYGTGEHPDKGDGIHDYCDRCEGTGEIK